MAEQTARKLVDLRWTLPLHFPLNLFSKGPSSLPRHLHYSPLKELRFWGIILKLGVLYYLKGYYPMWFNLDILTELVSTNENENFFFENQSDAKPSNQCFLLVVLPCKALSVSYKRTFIFNMKKCTQVTSTNNILYCY